MIAVQQKQEDEQSGLTSEPVQSLQNRISAAFNTSRSQGTAAMARLLRETLENITQGVVMFDAEHRAVVWNQRALELLELPGELMEQHPALDDIMAYQASQGEFSPEQLDVVRELRSADFNHSTTTVERTRPNGIMLKITTMPLSFGGFVRTFTDVTEARQRQSKQLADEREFRLLYENAAIGLYRSTIDGRIIRSNRYLVELNGCESEHELIHSVVENAGEWYTDPTRLDTFQAKVLTEGQIVGFESEVFLPRKNKKIWISENAWLVRDDQGNPAFFEGTVYDITDRKRSELKLAHLANHDHLTGLCNRTSLFASIGDQIQTATSVSPVHLLTVDLDGFKDINDHFGHEAGDMLLQSVSQRLKSLSPVDARIARFGGDEFVLFISSLYNDAAAASFASRLVKGLSVPYRVLGQTVTVGVSIGIACGPADGSTINDLFRASDAALYQAKAAGKQTYRFFASSQGPEFLKSRALESDLRLAIANRKLHVAFQPIVRVEDATPVCREALVRWKDPQRGFVSPANFLPAAERIGMMRTLERFVIEEACRTARRDPAGLSVAVNVSPNEISSGNFLELLRDALSNTGCPPSRLEIEITEGVILSEDQQTMKTLEAIREMGLRIALDDFGAGYSSLVYLQRFRFDKIKIDQYFLRNARADKVDIAILRSVINLGKDIGTDIVVEGVETEKERDLLAELGCVYAQGYHFGRPEPLSF
jgi:diguanylate cyclase (GGDEF)-like protein/PAS domain S-box-containing protein